MSTAAKTGTKKRKAPAKPKAEEEVAVPVEVIPAPVAEPGETVESIPAAATNPEGAPKVVETPAELVISVSNKHRKRNFHRYRKRRRNSPRRSNKFTKKEVSNCK